MTPTRGAVALVTALLVGGCSAAPRQRPIELGPVDTGAGSVEAARRQLQGEWNLVRLETPGPSGESRAVAARALLTYDEYGNFTIAGKVEDPSVTRVEVDRLLRFSGRAVIDARKQELRLFPSGDSPPLDGTAISVDRVRRYAFENEMLRMSTVDANGQITATSTWQRRR